MPVTEFVPNRTTKLLRFYVARHARMLPHVPPTACAPSWYTRATHSTVPLQQSMSKCPLVCRISVHFVRFASIFSRTCPKRYFSSYLDRSISRFEESVSFDSQSRRFFFIDERQVWEIHSFFLIWESIFNWIHQWTINVDHPILDARVKIILQSFILKLHRSSNDVPPPLGLFWKSPSGFSAIRFEINVVKIKRWRNKLDVDQSRKPIPIRDGGYFHQSAFCFLEMLLKRIVQILDHTMDRELVWEMYHPKEIVIERG